VSNDYGRLIGLAAAGLLGYVAYKAWQARAAPGAGGLPSGGRFRIVGLEVTPRKPMPGYTVQVIVTVYNEASEAGTCDILITRDGSVVASQKDVIVGPRMNQQASMFFTAPETTGKYTYTVEVLDKNGNLHDRKAFTIEVVSTPPPPPPPGKVSASLEAFHVNFCEAGSVYVKVCGEYAKVKVCKDGHDPVIVKVYITNPLGDTDQIVDDLTPYGSGCWEYDGTASRIYHLEPGKAYRYTVTVKVYDISGKLLLNKSWSIKVITPR